MLDWVLRRVAGEADAESTPVGLVPAPGALPLDGLDVSEVDLAALLAVDADSWSHEADLTEEFFAQFGDRLPPELADQLTALRTRLGTATR